METQKPILSPKEIKILETFADLLIPPSEKLPKKPSEMGVAAAVDDLLHYASPNLVRAFRLGLRYVEWKGYFFKSSFSRFTQMEKEIQSEYVAESIDSHNFVIKTLLRVLESFIFTTYYSDEEICRKIGYEVKKPNKTPSKDLYGDQVVLGSNRDESIEVDVCVIGSGAGAAPIASDLAEAGLNVAILEEGGRFDLNDFTKDAVHRAKKMYREGGFSSTIGIPTVLLPYGKGIGGTTLINSGTCFRTPDSVLETWRSAYGLDSLCPEELEPYYQKVEKTINVMEVPEDLLGNSARVIRRGFEKMGIHGAPLKRNIRGCEGSSLCCFGCPTDAKQSVQLNYIPNALKHGAKLYAYCRVDRLIEKNGRITEVEASYLDPNDQSVRSRLKVRAKWFILAAGTIYTPILMKGSKVGLKSGHVGRHLTIHPASKAYGLFEEKIRGWEGVPQSYYSADYKDQGITFEGIFVPPSLTAVTLLFRGAEHKKIMENFEHIATFGFLVMDESRGRVLRRRNGEPVILYSMNKKDLKKFTDATVLLSRMFFEAGAKEIYIPIHKIPKLCSPDEVSRIYSENLKPKDFEVLAFHPLGTCRMGKDPVHSVVNEHGQVHGIENLYITDGSVFPTSLGVNPQVTIMALSHRTAKHLLSRI